MLPLYRLGAKPFARSIEPGERRILQRAARAEREGAVRRSTERRFGDLRRDRKRSRPTPGAGRIELLCRPDRHRRRRRGSPGSRTYESSHSAAVWRSGESRAPTNPSVRCCCLYPTQSHYSAGRPAETLVAFPHPFRLVDSSTPAPGSRRPRALATALMSLSFSVDEEDHALRAPGARRTRCLEAAS